MLLERIKADQIAARKSEDRATPVGKMKINALTTLIGEASPAGTAVASDEDVQKIVRKFVKNLDESISVVRFRMESDTVNGFVVDEEVDYKFHMMLIERQMYLQYLPATFDESDVAEIAGQMPGANIGAVMGACKKAALAANKMFDGAIVQKVLKGL